MSYEASLLIDGQQPLDIISMACMFFSTFHRDKEEIYHEFISRGVITPQFAEHQSRYRNTTDISGNILGPIFHITTVAKDVNHYIHWMKGQRSQKGEVMVFRSDDELMPMKRFKFWDGYLLNIEGVNSRNPEQPLLMNLYISAAVIRINEMEFKNTWYITDPDRDTVNPFAPGFQRQEAIPDVTEEVEETDTEVAKISMMDELDYNSQLNKSVLKLRKNYRIKVDSYTTRDRYASESIKWIWGYMSAPKGGASTFKQLGAHTGGDVLNFKIEDPDTLEKDIIFYAYIHDKEAGGKCEVPVEPFYYYKGVREWGKFQEDLARQNSRIPINELKAKLGESRYKKRAEPYLHKGQAEVDYRFALAKVLSKKIAEEVMQNFYYGNGKKLSYGPGTKLGNDLQKHSGFQSYFKKYLNFIKRFLADRDLENIDEGQFEKELALINFSNKLEILKYDFYGLMGGTQKARVEFEVQQISQNQYEVKTTMYIKDWYGADWDDINSNSGIKSFQESGLWAFFMLQHYHSCTPFESELIYESTDIISL